MVKIPSPLPLSKEKDNLLLVGTYCRFATRRDAFWWRSVELQLVSSPIIVLLKYSKRCDKTNRFLMKDPASCQEKTWSEHIRTKNYSKKSHPDWEFLYSKFLKHNIKPETTIFVVLRLHSVWNHPGSKFGVVGYREREGEGVPNPNRTILRFY